MVNRRISPDLKLAALRLWDLGWDEIDIIQGLAVSHSSMYRWKALFEAIGDVVWPPSPLHGRTRIICRAVLTAVQDIYRAEPDLYLDELVFWLAVHHDIVISKSALILRSRYHKLIVLLAKEELSEGGIADSQLKKQILRGLSRSSNRKLRHRDRSKHGSTSWCVNSLVLSEVSRRGRFLDVGCISNLV